MTTKTIVFDLDDTLVYEVEYVMSAFKSIARIADRENTEQLYNQMITWFKNKENVFENIIKLYPNMFMESLKNIYRFHSPLFNHKTVNRLLLEDLKEQGYKLGLITDGFSVTQRNKIKALDIENLFDLIIISEEFGSEKPHEDNYIAFHQFQTDQYFYVGDNTKKDFITPNKLGWTTICLLNKGHNIHKQNFDLDLIYLPKISITTLSDLKLHI